jgi:hypothetical protein
MTTHGSFNLGPGQHNPSQHTAHAVHAARPYILARCKCSPYVWHGITCIAHAAQPQLNIIAQPSPTQPKPTYQPSSLKFPAQAHQPSSLGIQHPMLHITASLMRCTTEQVGVGERQAPGRYQEFEPARAPARSYGSQLMRSELTHFSSRAPNTNL